MATHSATMVLNGSCILCICIYNFTFQLKLISFYNFTHFISSYVLHSLQEYKYIIALLIFRIVFIFKINISASWKDAFPFGGCDGVTSEENWCAKLGFIDDVIDLMPCMCVCVFVRQRSRYWQKGVWCER